jgi:predicted patatin/cPLA2 family phospholipase
VNAFRRSLGPTLVTDQPWNALALSGGGQWGAFGAGFLNGWTEAEDRPEFQVVTGTSTGALQATFAFLGSEYDNHLRDAYLGITGDEDVFEKRFALFVPFSNSLYTTGPLRERLNEAITTDVFEDVAEQAEAGRRLFVGAVEIEKGVFRAFDLTAIARRGDEEARQDYIDALMASAAIPVAFPPVEIDGATYVDGGTRRNIFLEAITAEIQLRRLEETAPSEATVYCLVNSTLNVGYAAVDDNLLEIALRATDVLLDESTEGNLLRIYLQARKENLRFRMALIPSSACNAVGSGEHDFDPDLMRCLYDEGRRIAAESAEPWWDEPPLAVGAP